MSDNHNPDRRWLMQILALGAAGGAAAPAAAQGMDHSGHGAMDHGAMSHGSMDHGAMPQAAPGFDHSSHFRIPGPKPKIAMLVYPDMVLLDLVGPQTVLTIAQCEIILVWKSRTPCSTDTGTAVVPTHTFADCPRDIDVLFIPGGIIGSTACMNDPEVLAFVAEIGARAKYVTSVCTGSLVLAAAGLLKGYKATSLWVVAHLLPTMGAIQTEGRVVIDRNRMTGGGVTAGIDFGLLLAAKLRSEEIAKRAQLIIEYAPDPPFNSGTPQTADPALLAKVKGARVGMDAGATAAAQAAAKRLGLTT